MKEFWGSFSTHLKRGVFSPIFLICTALCTFMMFMFAGSAFNSEYYPDTEPGLNHFLDLVDHAGAKYFMMMITSFPSAMLFFDDWKSGAFKFMITRTGRKKYTFAVTLAAGVTAAAAITISYIVFSAVILTRFPLIDEVRADAGENDLRMSVMGFPNSGLLMAGKPILCYFLYFLQRGAMAAFFAVVAVFQSMIITNKHLTAISPVLAYIFYFSFNLFNVIPALANPFVLFWNGFKLYLVFGGTPFGSLFSPLAAVYPMFFCAAVTVLLSIVEWKILRVKMNRRL